ncbi:GAF and ANTAR domain-containing protein [Cellulosimicrobium sp. Marseille-Q4280]|uniref:GAF and ANTAR domain-containing protein n=1 Tax=Cellulosimicrobium sp. Marseille-Q4280 TaxID=2937992 RepID=UPI00203E62A3|nr:GAF and ANTAR domain-containing protein [Cellulosimicrobium sp. Marseille-Q4280]
MTPRTPTDSLADAARALLGEHDVTDLLARLTRDAVLFAGADAAGLLVRADGRLETLTTTSHAAEHLEAFQSQRAEGPCVDVVETGQAVEAVGRQEIVDRWPTVGPAIVAAGFRVVHAVPLAWQGGVVGGLNVFGREPLTDEQRRSVRACADMLTLVVGQPYRLSTLDFGRSIARALRDRVVVEQAKGALAHLLDVDVSAAYDELVARSERDGVSLTAVAHDVLLEAQAG